MTKTNYSTASTWVSVAVAGMMSLVACLASGAVAQAAEAQPNLSGPWIISNPPSALKTSDGGAPPFTAEGKQLYQDNMAMKAKGDTDYDSIKRCVPPGIPRLSMQPFPFDIVQGERHVAIMHEWNHLPRIVYLAEGHFEGIGPTYLGQSVGKYQGDTLVVDTNQFNDQTLLDDSGMPHSDELTTVERYRLIDGGKHLQVKVTITDPKIFTKPWETTLTFDKSPAGTIVKEDYCFRRTGIVK